MWRSGVFIAVVTAAVFCNAQQASSRSMAAQQMRHAISRVRTSKTVTEKTDAAQHLASVAEKINRKEVTDPIIADLISLLDSPDDSVRFWVATALGNLGPCAKAAIPQLEALLPKADCLDGAITSASGIRYALKQMGVKPPPRPNCTPIAG
jgi:HEAT repeat protein